MFNTRDVINVMNDIMGYYFYFFVFSVIVHEITITQIIKSNLFLKNRCFLFMFNTRDVINVMNDIMGYYFYFLFLMLRCDQYQFQWKNEKWWKWRDNKLFNYKTHFCFLYQTFLGTRLISIYSFIHKTQNNLIFTYAFKNWEIKIFVFREHGKIFRFFWIR